LTEGVSATHGVGMTSDPHEDIDELDSIAREGSHRSLIERDIDADAERRLVPGGAELPDHLDAPIETPVDDLLDQELTEDLDDDEHDV
jgi:hypothetical protein